MSNEVINYGRRWYYFFNIPCLIILLPVAGLSILGIGLSYGFASAGDSTVDFYDALFAIAVLGTFVVIYTINSLTLLSDIFQRKLSKSKMNLVTGLYAFLILLFIFLIFIPLFILPTVS